MGASPSVEKILAENLSPSEQWEYKFFKPLVCGASLSYVILSVFIIFFCNKGYFSFLLLSLIPVSSLLCGLAIRRLCDRHHAIARKALANLKAKHVTEAGMTPTSLA